MIYSFDNFEINHGLREVSLNNQLLNVEPKVYELIIFFIENTNQAISKDALQDAIWPSVEVSETAVTRAIMKARKVLTDPESPKNYIQTIHGHGYKFIAEHLTSVSAEQYQTKPQSIKQSRLSIKSILGFLLLMSFMAVAFVYIIQLKATPRNTQLMVLPVFNQVDDENYSWVSLGFMALSAKIIETNADIWVLPENDSLKAQELLGEPHFPLTQAQVETLKTNLAIDYLVASRLSQAENKEFELSFEVYHPKGVFSNMLLKGENPTELVQKMSTQIAQFLPGKVINQNYMAISDDSFTNELYSRGMSYQIQGYVDKAQNYFELAIEQDESLLLPKYELAVVKRKQNKLEESKSDLQQLLKDFDSYSNTPLDRIKILNSLGITYLRMLNNDEAMKHYLLAYDLAKKHQAFRYVVKAANNIAIVERRKNNYEAATKWAYEALSVIEKHKLQEKHTVLYLIGQIERDRGHIDKALDLFEVAYQENLNAKMYKEASAVLSATGGLLRKKGLFQKAHETIHQALDLKTKINDKLGLTDSYISDIEIYLDEGNLLKSKQLLEDLKQYVQQNNITSRESHIIKIEALLEFKEGHYQQVVDIIDNRAAGLKSLNLDMLRLKSQQQLGDNLVIKTWLQEHQHYQTDNNHMMRLYWLDFENFYLEANGTQEQLMGSYQNRLELSKLMGNDTLSAGLMLKIGFQYLQEQNFEQAQNTLNQIRSLNLNWWQFDLFEALLLNAEHNQAAIELAKKAKSQAGQSWQDKHEIVLNNLLNGDNPITETKLLF